MSSGSRKFTQEVVREKKSRFSLTSYCMVAKTGRADEVKTVLLQLDIFDGVKELNHYLNRIMIITRIYTCVCCYVVLGSTRTRSQSFQRDQGREACRRCKGACG